MRQRTFIRPSFAAVVVLAALAAPAFASSVIHAANTEMGYTTHPDHAQSSRSRAEVVAEIEQSRKDGTWNFYRVGAPVPTKNAAPLTREQVLADLKRAQAHPSWAARRVGAPVSAP